MFAGTCAPGCKKPELGRWGEPKVGWFEEGQFPKCKAKQPVDDPSSTSKVGATVISQEMDVCVHLNSCCGARGAMAPLANNHPRIDVEMSICMRTHGLVCTHAGKHQATPYQSIHTSIKCMLLDHPGLPSIHDVFPTIHSHYLC